MVCMELRHFGQDEWHNIVSSMEDLSIMQTWEFGEAKAKIGPWKVSRGLFWKDEEIAGAIQAMIRTIPFLTRGLVWINRGPLIKDKSKGYDIEKGEHHIVVKHKNTPPVSKEKLYLMGVVSKLRNDGMSYSEISEHLNKEGIKSMRGKTWTKHSVGRFIIYFTKNVNLMEIPREPVTDLRGKKKR